MSDSREQYTTNQTFLPVLFALLTAFAAWPMLQSLSTHLVKPVLTAVVGMPDDFTVVIGQTFTQNEAGEQVAIENAIGVAAIATEFMASAILIALIFLAYLVVSRGRTSITRNAG